MLNARCTQAILLAIVLAFLSQLVWGQTKPATQPIAPLRVLFIGDGYTSANGGLDQVVQALAKGKGRVIECVASTSFGKSLAWHWETGAARATIGKGGWDFVVVQGPPPRNVIEREQLAQALRLFDDAIKRVHAKPILLATWGSAMATEAERAQTEPIERLTEELDVKLAPIGLAEERAIEEKPGLKLRAKENGFPTPAGTYLAASAVYATITGESAEGLAPSVKTAGRSFALTAGDAAILQRAANAAVGIAVATAAEAKAATAPANRRVVYVLDATGTMLGLKFKLLQAQMDVELKALGPDDRFNLIFFRGGDNNAEWVHAFSTKLERGDDAGLQRARGFMGRTEVVGKGTNPLPALQLAFKNKPDVIHFLTDGEFNNVVSYDEVLAQVRRLNAANRTRVNTVAFMSDDQKSEHTLIEMAKANGGTFVKVKERDLEKDKTPFDRLPL